MDGLSEKLEQKRTAEVSSASRSKDEKKKCMRSKENMVSKVKITNEIELSGSLALYQRLYSSLP